MILKDRIAFPPRLCYLELKIMNPNQAATDLLDQLGLKNQFPLPLQKVVDHIGYQVQLFQPGDKTRNLACGVSHDQKTIFANSADQPAEQRYAFARAIGHAVLHPGKNIVVKKSSLHFSNEEPEEMEANLFADELLMESVLFLTKWDELNMDIGKMAQAFGLTKERITARATILGIL